MDYDKFLLHLKTDVGLYYLSGLTGSDGVGEPAYTRNPHLAAEFTDRSFADRMVAILDARTNTSHSVVPARRARVG